MSESVPTLPASIVAAESLPSLPSVAVEVLRLSRDENADIDDFAGVISRDPALAAQLLKLSNSSLFSLGNEVTTLSQATMVLGLKTVQLMSLSFSLANELPRSGSSAGFDYQEYWQRSLLASVAGRAYSNLLNLPLAGEAFMCGLFSSMGRLVIAQTLPDEYARVTEEHGSWPGVEAERKGLGFDSAAVGSALLRSWEIPEVICSVVEHHLEPSGLPADVGSQVADLCWIMNMADHTVCALLDEDKGDAFHTLVASFGKRGVPEAALDNTLFELGSAVHEAGELFDLDTGLGVAVSDILAEAREQMVRISLGTAASLEKERRRSAQLESDKRRLATAATTDRLTGIRNRAGFDEVIAEEIECRTKERVPNALGLLLFDIDHFKVFNDTHGHQAGDKVLRIVGGVLKRLTRETDVPARYGGEEFAVVVPQTNPVALRGYAERIRKTIESVPISLKSEAASVTVSIGGVCLRTARGPEDVERMIELADQELYRCKGAGRNCSSIVREPLDAE